ncbi:MAG: hypothetical protein K2F83_05470, partial [Oscillospiraceae bacterium]|nr:hypothetical protein [Oscillospiraceae bacterium]
MIDRALIVDSKVNPLMVSLSAGDQSKDKINVLKADKKLVLGTLSFRVVDLDLLPTITKKFDGLTDVVYEDNHAKDDANDKLIYFTRRATTEAVATPWGIGYLKGTERDREHAFYNDIKEDRDARATFTYDLPRTIIKARAAEAELTINAYQAYTAGSVADIDEALQRYSPAITVTYSDGSEGNFIMPWGRMDDEVDGLDWTVTEVYDWAEENWRDNNGNLKTDWKAPLSTRKLVVDHPEPMGTTTQIQYDPTASRYKPDNQRYLVQKDFCYEERGENKVFPLPIDVRLTVTPITLIDVTANDLARSYVLSDTLVDGVTAVQSLSALKLPSQARLITDVPAGGVTLTMDIPGWSHPQDYTVDGGMETRYWPSANTDPNNPGIVLNGTGETVADLWNDRAKNETEGAFLHWPTISDKGQFSTTSPVTDGNGAYLGANRAGVYTFKMAEGYGGNPKYFTRSEIQALYPWLTVPDSTKIPTDIEAWPIDDATRTIVWNGDPTPPNPDDPPKKELVDTNAYVVEYISTLDGTNEQPELTLRVHKIEVGYPDNWISLPDASIFRIKLPDGTEMAVGYTESVHGVNQGGDWFAANDGHYEEKAVEGLSSTRDKRGFDLISNPGDPSKPGYGDEREKLRRYINLGGWFYVSVKERESTDDGAGNVTTTDLTTWSDFMPVYVPPRDNYYTESKEYNFIGDNAGLYPWAGGLSTTVILPPGTYNPVALNAGVIAPVYESGTTRKVERYDLTTTYDGATGAQPGRLNTFTIDPASGNNWGRTGPVSAVNATDGTTRSVTTYGPEVFKDSVLYNAYGKVLNKITDRGMDPITYAPDAEKATVRLEETEAAHPEEKIILEYVETHGGEMSVDYDDTNGYDPDYWARYNVSNVIFETKTQGYTARQDYVLRIRNVGDVDIHGLSIDTLTDLVGNPIYDKELDSNPAGGHFEILKPPASFLPAGESTTFVLTYVYNLNARPSAPMNYRDKLFITSNSKHRVGVGAYNDYHDPLTSDADKPYLLDFDAQFQVTNSDIYRVFVRYIPTDGCMGTAGVIIGLENDDVTKPMNTSAGPTAYAEGDTVYILISPTDEYTMVNVWAANTAIPTQRVPIGPYDANTGGTGNLSAGDVRMVYAFTMPAHDTTVTVVFNEPTRSKLRISDLRVYRDLDHSVPEEPNCLYPWNGTDDARDNAADWEAIVDPSTGRKYKDAFEELPIWQKSFTDAEQATANGYTQGDNKNLYLMTQGAADKPGSRPNFVDTVEQYLVVLPFEADIAQVEIDLRKVLYLFDTANGDPIDNKALSNILVQMTLFDSKDLLTQPQNPERIFSGDGEPIYTDTWNSAPYAGWHLGETNGPTTHTSFPFLAPEPGTSKYVRVELSYTDGTETESRAYYLEIHRATEEVEAELHYGNSPYGMIMNATNINAANKNNAKAAFVNNNYTFVKSDDLTTLTPKAVTDGDLTGLHYWLEAWAEPTEKWKAPKADWSTTNNYDPDPTA